MDYPYCTVNLIILIIHIINFYKIKTIRSLIYRYYKVKKLNSVYSNKENCMKIHNQHFYFLYNNFKNDNVYNYFKMKGNPIRILKLCIKNHFVYIKINLKNNYFSLTFLDPHYIIDNRTKEEIKNISNVIFIND